MYTNAVTSAFTDNTYDFSWRNPQDGSTYVSAPYSYGVTYQAYGAIEFIYRNGTVNPASYKALEYNINTGGQPLGYFGVTIADSSSNWINEIKLSSSNVTQTLPGGWVHVKIPLATLDPANTGIKYIDLENARGTAEAKIWVDDAQFSL